MKVHFAKTDRDTVQLQGTVDLGSSFAPVGHRVLIDVGGATLAFVLDGKGKGVNTNTHSTCQLKLKSKTTLWTVKANFKKGNWRAPWEAYGLTNGLTNAPIANPSNKVLVPVILVVGDESFMNEPTLTYTSTKDKSGLAK